MRFFIVKVSDSSFIQDREISTIEDLQALAKEHPGWHGEGDCQELIIKFAKDSRTQNVITIYDDYIE